LAFSVDDVPKRRSQRFCDRKPAEQKVPEPVGARRSPAPETLTLVGEPAVPPLRGLLSAADKRIRWEAAKCLAEMVDPASVDAFAELVRAVFRSGPACWKRLGAKRIGQDNRHALSHGPRTISGASGL